MAWVKISMLLRGNWSTLAGKNTAGFLNGPKCPKKLVSFGLNCYLPNGDLVSMAKFKSLVIWRHFE